jgi:hypothetical protein
VKVRSDASISLTILRCLKHSRGNQFRRHCFGFQLLVLVIFLLPTVFKLIIGTQQIGFLIFGLDVDNKPGAISILSARRSSDAAGPFIIDWNSVFKAMLELSCEWSEMVR